MLELPFYVISDTHWFHKNIIKYSGRDMNHNNIMIENWNKVIGPDDKILHLGDLVFTYDEKKQDEFFYSVAPRLQGDKYLILGNHDNHHEWEYEQAGFKVIPPFIMPYRGRQISFDHYPTDKDVIDRRDNSYIRVHGHIHNSGYEYKSLHSPMTRHGNINVCVEMIDYTPQSIEKLLDEAIG